MKIHVTEESKTPIRDQLSSALADVETLKFAVRNADKIIKALKTEAERLKEEVIKEATARANEGGQILMLKVEVERLKADVKDLHEACEQKQECIEGLKVWVDCDVCAGTGKIFEGECICKGTGKASVAKTEIHIILLTVERENARLKAALATKDAALDRLERPVKHALGWHNCFACWVRDDTKHAPDCWWRAARIAGREK